MSHASAAALWNLLPSSSTAGVVHVTVSAGNPRRPGVRTHRVGTLRGNEITTLDGIPVTTPARTLYDLAGCIRGRQLERAVAEALARKLTAPPELGRLLARHVGRRGSRALQALLDGGPPALTRSEAEERLLVLVRKARLARPELNRQAGGHEVDFLWRKERLVVEVDGFTFHSSARAFERDRRRDADLVAAGLRVVRVTWKQLENEPEAVAARLAQALAVCGGSRR